MNLRRWTLATITFAVLGCDADGTAAAPDASAPSADAEPAASQAAGASAPSAAATPAAAAPAGTPLPVAEAPAVLAAAEPTVAAPKVYAATLEGSCEHFVACGCDQVTVPQCVDTMTEQTGGQPLPASLYSCLNGLECDDLCAESSAGVARCTEAASAQIMAAANAQARQEQAAHAAAMGIIGNMGTTCPSGQRLVNGSCVSY